MKIFVIPDTQIKPGVPIDHLRWAGNYVVAKQPDVIVMIGDWADMPSLSSYDVGKKASIGRTYLQDVDASIAGMKEFFGPINAYNERQRKNGKKQYLPRKVLTLGNHEDRISRAIEADPKLDGTISLDDLKYKEFGWEVYPYLEPVVIGGVAFCHFFTTGVMGRPVTSAQALLSKKHQSCVMGHVQGRSIAFATRADGRQMTGIFVGGFYQHDEDYLRWQGNAQTWRGVWMLHQVEDGSFDEMPISMDFLRKKYD